MKKVAILGCGPAGLLAAHAAHILRVDAKVFGIKQMSVIDGAQFLHEEIPHLDCGTPKPIKIIKFGTAEGYANKVYGDVGAPCSFDLLQPGEVPAWPMQPTYQLLWDLYSELITNVRLFPADIGVLVNEYDLVISTVPRQLLCKHRGVHEFDSQHVFFAHRAMYRSSEPAYVVYNGNDGEHEDWYRCSKIWGLESTEVSAARLSEADAFVRAYTKHGIKPLSTNCTCDPDVLRIGRFGKWQKGVLVHHAFQEALNALQSL
jgi:hypothetical protein